MNLQVDFGAPQTGVGYRFYSATGAWLSARSTAGVVALPMAGSYLVVATLPADTAGVYWDCADANFTAEEQLTGPSAPPDAATPPGPPSDVAVCRVYGYLTTPNNHPAANVEITITLVAPNPVRTNRLISGRAVKIKTDSAGRIANRNGDLWVEFQRNDVLVPSGSSYQVTSPDLNMRSVAMTLAAATFDLASLVT